MMKKNTDTEQSKAGHSKWPKIFAHTQTIHIQIMQNISPPDKHLYSELCSGPSDCDKMTHIFFEHFKQHANRNNPHY